MKDFTPKKKFTCSYMVSLECGHRIKMRIFPFPKGKYYCSTPGCGTYQAQRWTEWYNMEFAESERQVYKNRDLE